MSRARCSSEEQAKKDAKTRIVAKPLDKDIVSSRDIKRAMRQRYPGVGIERCYATAGGSFVMEFEDKVNAEKMDKDWDTALFGNNSGLKNFDTPNCVAVIKDVFEDDLTDDQLKEEIKKLLPLCEKSEVELFKRRNRQKNTEEFTGTIKVVLKDRASLEKAVKEGIKLNNQSCKVDEWVNKPKFRYCFKCQAFGHVAHRCRSRKPRCGKCSTIGHETKDCTVLDETKYKCAHCGKNHITGIYRLCSKLREEIEKHNQRFHHG